jgi:hypothetical protein
VTWGKKAEEKKEAPTLRDFRDEYIDWCRGERYKASGIESREGVLRAHLLPLFGDRRLDSFEPKDQVKLRKHFEDASKSTHNNLATVLNSVLEAARVLEKIGSVPHKFRSLQAPGPGRGLLRLRSIRVDGRGRASHQHDGGSHRTLGRRGWATSERDVPAPLELVRSPAESVDGTRGRGGRRQGARAKGREMRVVPMTARLRDALKRHQHLIGDRVLYRNGKLFTDRSMRRLLMAVQRRAKLKVNGNTHVLRHTFCSRLVSNGVPLTVVQKLAGHRSIQTTMRYAHLAPGETHRAIATLEQPSEQPSGVVIPMARHQTSR